MWFAIEDEKCIQIHKNFHGWRAKKANMAARNLTKVGKSLDKSQSLIISAQKIIVIPQQ